MADKILRHQGFKTIPLRLSQALQTEAPSRKEEDKQQPIITIYLKPEQQKKYYEYIFSLHPERIIFNPGAENPEFMHMAQNRNIQVISGCTVALLVNHLL